MRYTNREEQIVARGTWLYGGTVPRSIELCRRPASLSGSRFIEDEHGEFVLDENLPIPTTPDGFVYRLSLGAGGEFKTITDAKSWANVQPWGPVVWDEES